MSMTIDELRKRKEDLESEVCALLNDFQRQTSVHVDLVDVDSDEFHLAGEKIPRRLLRGVRIRLDMGLT